MKTIWAETALLPSGWARDVSIAIGTDGRIAHVQKGVEKAGPTVGCLLPSPVNVHSHAFQRAMAGLTEHRGPDPSDSFWTWRKLMYSFLDQLRPEHVEAISALVQMEMLEAGYATNVEFHYLHHQPSGMAYDNLAEMSERIVAAAKRTGTGLTLLPVHYQYGGCDQRDLTKGQIRFGNTLDQFQSLCETASKSVSELDPDSGFGVAMHSLRAVAQEHLKAANDLFPSGPIHMHLAEQVPEVEEVQQHWGARPVEWALQNMGLDERWCLIHCTQMTKEETRDLAATGAVAGLCPITESNLGDGIFDAKLWADNGGSFSVGSDSNIRISLSEELRTLEYSQRLRDRKRAVLATLEQSSGRRMFEAILKGGAQASGRHTGRLETGYWADMCAIDTGSEFLWGKTEDAILDSWFFTADDRLVTDVWSAGRHMVKDGRHISREGIVRDYMKVLDSLEVAL